MYCIYMYVHVSAAVNPRLSCHMDTIQTHMYINYVMVHIAAAFLFIGHYMYYCTQSIYQVKATF